MELTICEMYDFSENDSKSQLQSNKQNKKLAKAESKQSQETTDKHEKPLPAKQKEVYIDGLHEGQFVAFHVTDDKVISAKVIALCSDLNRIMVQTKRGMTFNIAKTAIIWVKTNATDKWPHGVYVLLKGKGFKKNETQPSTR